MVLRFRPSALLAQSVEHFHGKEKVVGSIPTEGSPLDPCRQSEGRRGRKQLDLVAALVWGPSRSRGCLPLLAVRDEYVTDHQTRQRPTTSP